VTTKRILVICGTGVATSTVVVQKIRDYCKANGFDVAISQAAVADTLRGNLAADFIVATTQVPSSVTIPVIAGLPFLTGIGLDAVYAQIAAQIAA
jgi:PTS system galactitol-specific IIB component